MSELFEININKDLIFPFNIDFNYRKEIPNFRWDGPGIYLIFYKEELIYIGSYVSAGEKSNILKVRWWTHLASITMRGSKIGFGKKSNWEKKMAYLKNGELKQLLQKEKKHFKHRLRDTGCVSTEKRMQYACTNWSDFKNFNVDTLTQFNVQYFKILHPYNNIQQTIHQMELDLIREINPKCNKQYNDKMPSLSQEISVEKAKKIISKFS
jgi:hypothetical protein